MWWWHWRSLAVPHLQEHPGPGKDDPWLRVVGVDYGLARMAGGSSSATSAWIGTWGIILCCAAVHWGLEATRSPLWVSSTQTKNTDVQKPVLFPQTQVSRLQSPCVKSRGSEVQTQAPSLRPRYPSILSQIQGSRSQPFSFRPSPPPCLSSDLQHLPSFFPRALHFLLEAAESPGSCSAHLGCRARYPSHWLSHPGMDRQL